MRPEDKPAVITGTPAAREDWRRLTPEQKEDARRLLALLGMNPFVGWFWTRTEKKHVLWYVASAETAVSTGVTVIHQRFEHATWVDVIITEFRPRGVQTSHIDPQTGRDDN